MRTTVCDKSARVIESSDMARETDRGRDLLTPFRHRTGVTVVMPETNPDDDVFSQKDDYLQNAGRVAFCPTTTGDKA